jgi:GMP synthase-like glutamine amidotransferase
MEYTTLKKVHLFFYSLDENNNYNFILYKDSSNNKEEYTHIYNTITLSDNGSIYSLSRFLTQNFGNIFTDEFIQKLKENSNPEIKNNFQKLKLYELWENDIYIYWLDKLSQNLIQYDEINSEVIYFLEIPFISIDKYNSLMEKNFEEKKRFIYLNKNNINTIKISTELNNILNIISLLKIEEHIINTIKLKSEQKNKIYIILSLKTPGKDQNGFFHFPALFQSLYRKNNELWKYINVSTDGLPSEELLSKTKAILIPGSNLSVYNDYDFLRKTEIFLKKLIEDILFNNKYPSLKILGICFGMQIIINALGGKITKMKSQPKGTPELIEIIDDKFYEFNFYKNIGIEKKKFLKINEAHGDEISEYPDDKYKIKLYGSSQSCKNEIMVDDNEKILLIQGHPEYHPEFNSHRVAKFFIQFRLKKEPTKEEIEKFIYDYINKDEAKNVNVEEYRKMCYYFMKY